MTIIPLHYKPGDKIRMTYWTVPRTDGWYNGVVLEMVSPGVVLVEWDAGGISTINLHVGYTERR